MKIYALIIMFLIYLVGAFGYVLPYLFSARDSLLVFVGLAVLVMSLPASFYIGKAIVDEIKTLTHKE